jgi:AbrB family looped-hinge helix DNA binding protein
MSEEEKKIIRRKVSSRGQTVLPKELRDSLGIQPGDEVEFVRERTGSWQVRRRIPDHNPFEAAIGSLREHRKLKGSAEEIVEKIRGPFPK